MKKAELEQQDNDYQALMYKANAALRAGLYREAVDAAVAAWTFIDGMIQYQRKYADKQVTSVQAIDIVLRYAPLLMDFESLDRLEALLGSQKRIARSTGVDWDNRLAKARLTMWEAHGFWTCLEQQATIHESELTASHGADRRHKGHIVEEWIEMGLVSSSQTGKVPHLLLVTHLDQVVLAKCPSCAVVVKAPKAKCLDEHHCPKCHKKSTFVVLAKSPASPA